MQTITKKPIKKTLLNMDINDIEIFSIEQSDSVNQTICDVQLLSKTPIRFTRKTDKIKKIYIVTRTV